MIVTKLRLVIESLLLNLTRISANVQTKEKLRLLIKREQAKARLIYPTDSGFSKKTALSSIIRLQQMVTRYCRRSEELKIPDG
jgi:hypothetical protein